ncbi:MAG: transcription elongation factor GreA [Anaerolineales bacterium]|nr:transcription elongation factor GreA [Anaerolineales bacterium]
MGGNASRIDEKHYLTEEGYKKVKKELEFLTKVKRQEIADRLEFAIKQGDISENADYEIAREDMGFNEGKISELENILLNAKIIENNHTDDTVQVGSRVTVSEEGFPPETYKIVGPTEAFPADGFISNKSPVGSALLGKRVGDIARIKTPSGQIEMVITAID